MTRRKRFDQDIAKPILSQKHCANILTLSTSSTNQTIPPRIPPHSSWRGYEKQKERCTIYCSQHYILLPEAKAKLSSSRTSESSFRNRYRDRWSNYFFSWGIQLFFLFGYLNISQCSLISFLEAYKWVICSYEEQIGNTLPCSFATSIRKEKISSKTSIHAWYLAVACVARNIQQVPRLTPPILVDYITRRVRGSYSLEKLERGTPYIQVRRVPRMIVRRSIAGFQNHSLLIARCVFVHIRDAILYKLCDEITATSMNQRE